MRLGFEEQEHFSRNITIDGQKQPVDIHFGLLSGHDESQEEFAIRIVFKRIKSRTYQLGLSAMAEAQKLCQEIFEEKGLQSLPAKNTWSQSANNESMVYQAIAIPLPLRKTFTEKVIAGGLPITVSVTLSPYVPDDDTQSEMFVLRASYNDVSQVGALSMHSSVGSGAFALYSWASPTLIDYFREVPQKVQDVCAQICEQQGLTFRPDTGQFIDPLGKGGTTYRVLAERLPG